MPADFSFYNVVLAAHIAAVVVAFGVLFVYPIMFAVATRADPRALPALHRAAVILIGRLMSGGLLVVALAGFYLASKSHAWSDFYVDWGLAAVLSLGALAGAFLGPRERLLVDLSERDVGAAAGDGVTLSVEYQAVARQVVVASALAGLLVLITILFMATHLGAA